MIIKIPEGEYCNSLHGLSCVFLTNNHYCMAYEITLGCLNHTDIYEIDYKCQQCLDKEKVEVVYEG